MLSEMDIAFAASKQISELLMVHSGMGNMPENPAVPYHGKISHPARFATSGFHNFATITTDGRVAVLVTTQTSTIRHFVLVPETGAPLPLLDKLAGQGLRTGKSPNKKGRG